MKTSILASLALFASLSAHAALQPAGEFSLPHAIAMPYYHDKASCEADQGYWDADGDEGLCLFDAEDTVSVKASGAAYAVSVTTITTGGNNCGFDGTGKFAGAQVMEVSAPSQIWVPGGNGEGKLVDSVCRLRLEYTDENTVSVSVLTNDACRAFCGVRSDLTVEGARRK